MVDTTGRIPLCLVGTVAGILVIGLIGMLFGIHILVNRLAFTRGGR